jgi:hypothetical protein
VTDSRTALENGREVTAMKVEGLSASGVLAMLAKRHEADVFVPECKDGPTQTRSHRRLDAWVLLKTWSPITTIGYEIKVSRSDWRQDNKIHDYMPLCHLLYVVAPKGIVPAEELPAGVGLMEPVGDAGRLQVKRKAARREIALPAELMVYVLMCRTTITRERGMVMDGGSREWRIRELREWVQGKEERRALSYALSAKIRGKFEEQELAIERERRRNDEMESVRQRIAELGFDPSKPVSAWQVKERLNAFNFIVDNTTLRQMRTASEMIASAADSLERLKNREPETEEVA